MTDFPPTSRSRLRRVPERGRYDKSTIYPIIDEALICHVAFEHDGQPFVIPTIHARDGDRLLLHGARASRLLKVAQSGAPLSVAITLLDGLVMARSIFNHSMNYRSVVLFGRGRLVDEPAAKRQDLKTLSQRIAPGRWDDVRGPTEKELYATSLVSMALDSATAKVRSGPPGDDEADYALPVWAGVIPVQRVFAAPLPDPRLAPDLPLPNYLRDYRRP
ncbi:MAG: pyridoxamine 5'-phosphate oxidase family protein [Candidatus Promineifilaceae bacterium]|nr:pyridoxamine 5'-phosphate oxidase family protein [Candidatus Promineifilaceae bacterium]